ncbi:MAG: hypothetical protein M1456_00655 [Actinobacteria bacterium]|nr:hypothetical protein [Actinomycetota bacterium]
MAEGYRKNYRNKNNRRPQGTQQKAPVLPHSTTSPWDASAKNHRVVDAKIVILCCGAPAVPAALLGLVTGNWIIGTAVGVCVVVAGAFFLWNRSTSWLLKSLGCVPVGSGQYQHVMTVIKGICDSVGIELPHLYVVDDPSINTLSIGTSQKYMSLVFTGAFAGTLDSLEIEAAMAHEILHLRSREATVGTLAAFIALPLVVVLPGISKVVYRISGKGREMPADIRAVSLTRHPPSLYSALKLMSDTAERSILLKRAAGRATKYLWTVPLGERPDDMTQLGNVDHPYVRMSALQELY